MRRIVVGLMSTISALVLLFSYHTSLGSGTATAAGAPNPNGTGSDETTPTATASGDAGSSTTSGTSGSTPTASSTGTASSASSKASSKTTGTSGTYTGSVASTRWGPVQVKITVKNGKITQSTAVEYPNGNGRDYQINSYALPQLNAEVVQAQSGSIDTVSGATVTSDGYLQSLQSAIDQAHL